MTIFYRLFCLFNQIFENEEVLILQIWFKFSPLPEKDQGVDDCSCGVQALSLG